MKTSCIGFLFLILASTNSFASTFTISESFYYNNQWNGRNFEYNALYIYPDLVGELISFDLSMAEAFATYYAVDPHIGADYRIGPATASYNCFAYMLGYTNYWIESPLGFLSADYQLTTLSNERTIALQRQQTGSSYESRHGLKFTDSINGIAKSKCGMGGLYENHEVVFANYYEVLNHHTNYYKPKP